MASHTVKQGEYLSKIAKQYGWDWKKLYDHPDNADFKKKRSNPNLIHPGDEIVIPEKDPFGADIETGKSFTFKLSDGTNKLSVVLEDAEGEALGKKRFTLESDDGKVKEEGKTGGDGLVECDLPDDVEEVILNLWLDDEKEPSLSWALQIACLDPPEEISGVQGRLLNLGFFCGEVGGEMDEATEAALLAFKTKTELDPDSVLDDKTINKLKEIHRC